MWSLVLQKHFQTYKTSELKMFGMDVTIYVAFVCRRFVLFAAEGKTRDGVFPFDDDSEVDAELPSREATPSSDDEEGTMVVKPCCVDL